MPLYPPIEWVAKYLVVTYGSMVAADIVMALAFEQTMFSDYPRGFGPSLQQLTDLKHLKQYQMITIGGVAAYSFFAANNHGMGGTNQLMLTAIPLFYDIGQLSAILLAVQTMHKRFRRPDSPSDAGTKR